jgi:DNA-binding MarR family transcriptional regulator
MSQRAVRAVQRWYPQIYFACHTRHQRAASSETRLSAHDSAILAHLDEERPIAASALARHLGIGAPTLSATLTRLATLGYITRTPSAADRRIADLRLSKAGGRAMASSSVLEATRVATVLRELTTAEQRAALEGLALLARASRAVTRRQMRPKSATRKKAQRQRGERVFATGV